MNALVLSEKVMDIMARDVWGNYLTEIDLEVARNNGISKNTVEQRINKSGWSVNKAINKPLRYKFPKEYKLLAVKNGIKVETFARRVQRGWSLVDAATKQNTTDEERREIMRLACEKRRTIPKEIVEKAAKNGICYNTLRSRIQRGTPMEKASTIPPITTKQNKSMYNRGNFDWWLGKQQKE